MSNKNYNVETNFEINPVISIPTDGWLATKWRPAMGWMYMTVCIFDFIIFPILWSLMQSLLDGEVTSQWEPLTLSGAGLFHIAMGAVLGIAAYGRTQEKIKAVNDIGFINPYLSPVDPNDEFGQPIEPTRSNVTKRQSFSNSATTIPTFEGGPGEVE